jgi:hypothetical protein
MRTQDKKLRQMLKLKELLFSWQTGFSFICTESMKNNALSRNAVIVRDGKVFFEAWPNWYVLFSGMSFSNFAFNNI